MLSYNPKAARILVKSKWKCGRHEARTDKTGWLVYADIFQVWRLMHDELCLLFRSRNLSNNKLREIREGVFDGAGGVLELLLTGNKLQAVQGRMFRGLSGLKTLWVNYQLPNIPSCPWGKALVQYNTQNNTNL